MEEKPTVFVVDDDPGARQSLSWLLSQAGFPVQSFSSGRAFFDAFRPGELACLVLDVRMPEMSGLEMQQELSSRGVALPIIFVTAESDAATRVRAFHCGAFEFLEKPIDVRCSRHTSARRWLATPRKVNLARRRVDRRVWASPRQLRMSWPIRRDSPVHWASMARERGGRRQFQSPVVVSSREQSDAANRRRRATTTNRVR